MITNTYMTPELNIAITAALHAGSDIMGIYAGPDADFGIESKADNSPLTRADKAAHARIMGYLAPTGIPVLSEEGAQQPYSLRSAWQRLWVVDPLDGTKEFIKRNGEFTVNIALVSDGMPTLGVVFVPTTRILYYGEVGLGAFKTVVPPDAELASVAWHLSDSVFAAATALPVPQPQRPYTVVASRSHLSDETAGFIENLRRRHPNLQLRASGSSIKICLVAEGTADIYPRHAPTMEWDTAAGNAIALAAHCSVVDAATRQPLLYNKADLHNPWFIVGRPTDL